MGSCLSTNSGTAQEKGVPSAAAHVSSAAPDTGSKLSSNTGVLGKETPDVSVIYSLGKVLGRGQFGTTRLAVEKATGKEYACKSISKRKLTNKEDVEDVRREVQILHHLGGHPNITLLKGAFEDKYNVHLVMELCSGGELFDRIVSRGHYSEKDAATMCRTIVKVVGHCHSLGVMHRDLKPENFLLSSKAEDAPLKGCDFGLSVFYRPGEVFQDIVGSAYYVAPEVLRRKYGKEADLWSAGVILYILLSGVPPFWGETEQQIFDAILKGHVDFQSDPWPRISGQAKDCVRMLLTPDPRRRATADQVLQHPWMRENGTASSAPLDNIILKRMQGFSAMNQLKRKALLLIANNMAPEEVAGLRSIFQSIDKDHSGTITVDELKVGLREQGSTVTEAELADLVKSLDADNSGTIDYEEFLAGTLNLAALNKAENLKSAFESFDIDGDGKITREELQAGLKLQGAEGGMDVQAILAEVDRDGDGNIDYDEFVAMMMKGNEDVLHSKSTMRRGPHLKSMALV